MSPTHIHLINHTHWDREWFLTSVYTSQWIPGLIDKLEVLGRANPNFRYLFDGQTLVIEDLLHLAPDYEAKVKALVAAQTLQVGPYYCQPDWQLSAGETLIRNLKYGLEDVRRLGGQPGIGWLVDTFGHISQAPQIHASFNIDTVFVWRGVPQLAPFFEWRGADEHSLFAVDLFGGYRNLYGVTHAPDAAVRRLEAEAAQLRPYYPGGHLPLFDGYDLEVDPEDPLTFFKEQTAVPPDLLLQESTPQEFAAAVRDQSDLPIIKGELNSGKFGATFPGTFSARTYLKVMAYDCEQLLYRYCEPLAVMARQRGRVYPSDRYEKWSRAILQNAVHDCICGVSIDQVHEKMAFSYRQIFAAMQADLTDSLTYILADFAGGDYAVSTNPLPNESWRAADGRLFYLKTNGIGVWPASAQPLEQLDQSVSEFEWENEYYTARVTADGRVQMGEAAVGQLLVYAEHGDTYSNETGKLIGALALEGPLTLVYQHDDYAAVSYSARLAHDEIEVTAAVRLIFDRSPLVRWEIDLDSRGTDFRVEMVFDTAVAEGKTYAAMPFDIVERPTADTDLLPRQVEGELDKILMGQREVNRVHTFPMHDFVARAAEGRTAAVFAKGVRAYEAHEDGRVALTLRRAVEWVTAAELENRVGDAGPFFYVPDARCERRVRHEVGFYAGGSAVDSEPFLSLNQSFHNPPLVVASMGTGERTSWRFLKAAVPFATMHLQGDNVLARLFNLTTETIVLDEAHMVTNPWGEPAGVEGQIAPKQILTVKIPTPSIADAQIQPESIIVKEAPVWRVGENRGLPDPAKITALRARVTRLEKKIGAAEVNLEAAEGDERLRLLHQLYAQQRERCEYLLSARLNEIKLAMEGKVDEDYLYRPHPDIEKLGVELNQLRIKRRIFDYVVSVLE